MRTYRLALLIPAVVAAVAVTPAGALDSSKPSPSCLGPLVTDKAGDTADRLGATVDNLDITSVFIKDEPDKGAEAVTANIVVKNLNFDIPAGNTGIAWFVYYDVAGVTRFVRAVHDISGATVFEYGGFTDLTVTSLSPREGETPGKLFEGADGVVQLVIPAGEAKAGTELKNVYAETREVAQFVPSNIPSPTRGLGIATDAAPDTGGRTYKVEVPACAAAGAPKAGGPAAAFAVKLLTKSASAKKAKKGKTLAIKLKSSAAVTELTATLKKGSTSVGSGKLASLNGAGTLKLKLKSALKKGSYTLTVKGKDASGAKGKITQKFTVR